MEFLTVLFTFYPFALAIGLAVGIAAFGGAVLGRPVVPLLVYLAVFFTFAQSGYGSLDLRSNAVYFRGSGQLFFPLVFWGLLVAVGWTWLGRAFSNAKPVGTPSVNRWLMAWLALLVAHTAWGLASGAKLADILGGYGFVYLVWMAPLILLMVWSARDMGTLVLLARLLVLASLAKSVFGLARWAFFGGDPANYYQNFGNVNIKLTYFDIGDSMVCLLGAAVAASLLFVRRVTRQFQPWDLVNAMTVVLALACITLSYRRTVWGGVALAVLLLLWRMDAKVRFPVLLAGVPVFVAGLIFAASRRLGKQSGVDGIGSFVFDLVSSRTGAESTRALELRLAWESFAESPIFSIGSWGRYANSQLIPWQDSTTAGSLLHSGTLHIAMKSGLIGLFLLAGVIWAYTSQVRRLRREPDAISTALVIASCCGLLLMVPDFLFGTPTIQIRTTQLMAFCLGLPYMVSVALRQSQSGAIKP